MGADRGLQLGIDLSQMIFGSGNKLSIPYEVVVNLQKKKQLEAPEEGASVEVQEQSLRESLLSLLNSDCSSALTLVKKLDSESPVLIKSSPRTPESDLASCLQEHWTPADLKGQVKELEAFKIEFSIPCSQKSSEILLSFAEFIAKTSSQVKVGYRAE